MPYKVLRKWGQGKDKELCSVGVHPNHALSERYVKDEWTEPVAERLQAGYSLFIFESLVAAVKYCVQQHPKFLTQLEIWAVDAKRQKHSKSQLTTPFYYTDSKVIHSKMIELGVGLLSPARISFMPVGGSMFADAVKPTTVLANSKKDIQDLAKYFKVKK